MKQRMTKLRDKITFELLRKLLGYFISIAVVKYIYDHIEELKIITRLEFIDFIYLYLIFTLYLVAVSWRSIYILKKLKVIISFWEWFRLCMLGRLLNKFVSQGGNIYKSIKLKNDHKVPYAAFISSLASFLWLDVSLNLSVSLFAIIFCVPSMKIFEHSAILIIFLLLMFVLFIPIVIRLSAKKVKIQAKVINMMSIKVSQVIKTTLDIILDKKILVKVTLTGIMCLFLHYLLLCIAAKSLGINLGFIELLIFLSFLKLSLIVNITPGNIGVREILYGILGSSFGLKVSEGILLSALLRVNSYVVLVSLGLFFGGRTLLRDIKGKTGNIKSSSQNDSNDNEEYPG